MARDNIKEQISKAIRDMLGLVLVVSGRATIDPASVAAEASGDTTITATGALLGDFVMVGWETERFSGVNASVSYSVSAADTINVHISNGNAAAGAAIDVASTAVQWAVFRRSGS